MKRLAAAALPTRGAHLLPPQPRRLFLSSLAHSPSRPKPSPRCWSCSHFSPQSAFSTTTDPSTLLSQPAWSVRSLYPDTSSPTADESSTSPSPSSPTTISPPLLHHLLRLAALPLPSTPEEESSLLATLDQQLLFVQHIQRINTSGVAALHSIHDETAAGLTDVTIGLDTAAIEAELGQEAAMGKRRRARRATATITGADAGGVRSVGDWDPLGTATRSTGRYFVVRQMEVGGEEEVELNEFGEVVPGKKKKAMKPVELVFPPSISKHKLKAMRKAAKALARHPQKRDAKKGDGADGVMSFEDHFKV